jgi:hypothetical protein
MRDAVGPISVTGTGQEKLVIPMPSFIRTRSSDYFR